MRLHRAKILWRNLRKLYLVPENGLLTGESYMTILLRDQEKYNEGLREGRASRLKEGREDGIRGFIEDKVEDNVPADRIRQKLISHFQLTVEDADMYIRRFS